MKLDVLFVVSLLNACQVQVSGDETVFVQRGGDVLLDVKETVDLGEDIDFYWKFKTKINIVKSSLGVNPRVIKYIERFEFFKLNYSLLLKDLQHNDSGYYTAVLSGIEDEDVAKYKVVIQDPVSPVVLEVTSDPPGTDSCNLTTTCRTETSHINSTFTCDNQTCYQQGGEQAEVTTSGSSLRVFLFNDSIICNHSNQVSWKQDMKEIWTFCPKHAVSEGRSTIASWIWITILCVIVIVILGVALFKGVSGKCKIKDPKGGEYDVPQNNRPAQTESHTDDDSGPSSIYHKIGFHTGPETTDTRNTSSPETMYAQVDRAAKTNHRQQVENVIEMPSKE